MSQRLGLARSFEWVAQRRFDQLENSKRGVPLGPHPVGAVFAEFLMKDRLAISCPVQAGWPAATGPQSWACFSQVPRAEARSASAGRSGESGGGGKSKPRLNSSHLGISYAVFCL